MNIKTNSILKFLKSRLIFAGVAFLSIMLTVYIFLSSAELIFNKDYPFIETITKSAISDEIQYKIDQSQGSNYSYSFETLFAERELRYIEFPILNQKLELSKGINQDGSWMYKGNKANYFVTKNSKDQDNIVVYFPMSWRTILDISTLKLGDFIFLKTNDEWNYIFRIESVSNYSVEERFAVKAYDVMNLTIILEDNLTNSYHLIDAKVVSSRGDS